LSRDDAFDVIIIGAGPAGTACGYTLAKAGKTVLIIEKGETPGGKNVTGGRLYTYALEVLEPGLYKEAELERKVTHEQIMLLDADSSMNIDYHNSNYAGVDYAPHSYTVLRSSFDKWLADKAEEMGAMLVCGIKVDELIEKDGKIAGVLAGEDEMYADMVIAADGVNSFMAQKAGLIKDITAHSVGVGLKEIIELDPKTIEERFQLREGEGAARMVLGCSEGIPGGGFIYTNKESISLGCVLAPEKVQKQGKPVHEILQDFKMHPSIYPLLEGGKTIEYGAHLVSEAGYRGILKQPYREGFLVVGDAAGYVMNMGYSIRGIDLAMLSGIAAARAVISADQSTLVGPLYSKELDLLKLIPAMRKMDGYYDMLETPMLYDKVPHLANSVMKSVFSIEGDIPPNLKKEIRKLLKSNNISFIDLLKFGWKVVKAI